MKQLPRGVSLAVAVGVPFALLGVGIARVLPFIADDALISLRYADRWLAGQGLTWSDGDAVEGYSNLAWIVGCAALGALGVDLILAARILGVLATLGLFVAVYRFATRDGGDRLGALVANGLLALTGTLYVWSVGGLETPLVAMCLGFGWMWTDALLADRIGQGGATWRPWALGAVWGLLVLTRPDGPLFVAISGLALLWHHRGLGLRAVRWGAPVVGLPLAAWLGQLGFRLVYYGDWLPNPAHMKAEVTPERIREGLAYLGEVGVGYAPLVVVALLGLSRVRDARVRRTAPVLLVSMAAWAVYIASVGGDIFPALRHGAPIAVGLALLGALAFDGTTGRRRLGSSVVAGLAAVALLVGQPLLQANHRAVTERWEWDVAVNGRFLGAAFADEQPLVAVTAAGAVPYFSRLPALDLFGLSDRHIASTPSRGGMIGHDRGDGAYVLSREPDLVIFGLLGQHKPTRAYAEDFDEGSPFFERYLRVQLRGIDPWPITSRSWLRREGRIGLGREPDRVTVPGYFWPGTAAELGPDGEVVGRFPSHATPRSLPLSLPEGTWRARWPDHVAVDIAGVGRGRVDGRSTWIAGPVDLAITLRPVVGSAIPPLAFERVEADLGEASSLSVSPAVGVGGVVATVPFEASTLGVEGPTEVWSEPFEVPEGGVLAVRITGAPREGKLHVRVWRADRPVLAFAPVKGSATRLERLSGLDGETVRLQIVDRAPLPRVGIAVSDVALHALVPLVGPSTQP